MNLQGKINVIKEAKDDIKDAIIAKGVIPSGNISTYADAISEISTVNNTSLTVTPSTVSQTLRPSSSYTGYDVVNVQPVTNTIDANIIASNIKNGVSILGVNGNVVELNGQTKTITENGTYYPEGEYNGFSSVTVDISDNLNYIVFSGGRKTALLLNVSNNDYPLDLTEETLAYKVSDVYYENQNIIFVWLPCLKNITSSQAFSMIFRNCMNLTKINFSSLELIEAPAIFHQTFLGCRNLQNISFQSLTINSFGSFTNQFDEMLKGITGCTVHFPSNLRSVIGSWWDVMTGFGGTDTTILFDLPATT